MFDRVRKFWLTLALTISVFLGGFALPTNAANTIPKILNYQAKVTDAGGTAVPDGGLSIKISLYDAASGGSCLYTIRGTCGAPTTFSATTTSGTFSVLIGDTTMNAIPDSLFDNSAVYLGITIGSDSEMTPRKRFAAAAYAFDADRIDNLDTSNSGGTTAFVPTTDASGLLTLTGDPTTSNAVITANPVAATNELLIALKNNGSTKFTVDGEGDAVVNGSLTVNDPNVSPTNVIFKAGNSIDSVRYLTVSSTSTLVDPLATGNVKFGINTAAPTGKLTVADAPTAAANLLQITNYGDSIRYLTTSSTSTIFGAGSGTSPTTFRVGINNSNPATQLEVNAESGGSNSQLRVTTSGNGESNIIANNGGGANTLYMSTFGPSGGGTLMGITKNRMVSLTDRNSSQVDNFLVGSTLSANIVLGTGNEEKFRINTNGVMLAGPSYNRFLTASSTSTLIDPAASGLMKLGINTVAPTGKFTVADNATAFGNLIQVTDAADTARYFTVSSTSTYVRNKTFVDLNGTGTGNAVCASANGGTNVELVDCTTTPSADYKEVYATEAGVEAGDIVASGSSTVLTSEGDTVPKLAKTKTSYQSGILGIVVDPASMNDFNTVGSNIKPTDRPMPMALSGRVKVNVTGENGAISPGDPVTSSSTDGYGMKATAGGRVVGLALDTFTPANASATGTVMVFVNPTWFNGATAVSGSMVDSGLTVTQDSILDFKNSALTGVKALISKSGNWSITDDGYLVLKHIDADEVSTKSLKVKSRPDDAMRTAGVGHIQAGYDKVLVQNPNVTADSLIVVTFNGNPGSPWWVGEKTDGQFSVDLATGAPNDVTFTWWIVGVDGSLDAIAPPAAPPTDSGTSTPPTDSGGSGPTDSGSSTPPTDSGTSTPPTY